MKRCSPTTAALAFLSLSLIAFSAASASGQPIPAEPCATLADLRVADTNLLSATIVPATEDLPEHCRVLGYVRPAINFEIRLPTSGWNEKFYMAGCWGLCGTLDATTNYLHGINPALRRGYAASTMDTGHWGASLFDGRWAHNNRQAEIDFGYRAVHETARVTKALIEAFYGQEPAWSYFGGCSGAGRQAHVEAWRYPNDFDGIISACPWISPDEIITMGAWVAQANTGPDGRNLITAADIPMIEETLFAACDGADGLEDGLLSDPRTCSFDPTTLSCEDGETADCLQSAQVDALRKLYDGPRNSMGQSLHPGLPYGSEVDWGQWVTGRTADVNDDLWRFAATQYMRYMGLQQDPGESYEITEFDFDTDPARLDFMMSIYGADNPDLDAFRARGGKLLMWHGWSDASIPPWTSIAYYEAVEQRVGSREATQDFLRLFLIPGVGHCGSREGPGVTQSGIDPLSALERWVEHDEAPDHLPTTKTDSTGQVSWTRPVCPYPQRAVYDGEGDVSDSSSFGCVMP